MVKHYPALVTITAQKAGGEPPGSAYKAAILSYIGLQARVRRSGWFEDEVRLGVISYRSSSERGFTLFEALVALAVMAAGLAALGQLGFATVAAAHRAETRFLLTATARSVFAALPARPAPGDGALSGQIDGAEWRLQTSPFSFGAPGVSPDAAWVPRAMRLIVSGPKGGQIIVDTIRLVPTGTPR